MVSATHISINNLRDRNNGLGSDLCYNRILPQTVSERCRRNRRTTEIREIEIRVAYSFNSPFRRHPAAR